MCYFVEDWGIRQSHGLDYNEEQEEEDETVTVSPSDRNHRAETHNYNSLGKKRVITE